MRKKTFKKEKHVKNRLSDRTGLFTFQVFIDYVDDNFQKQRYTKSFPEKDYNTTKEAMEAACKHRDKKLNELSTYGMAKKDKYTTDELYELVDEVFPARFETKRKRKVNYYKYISSEFGSDDIKTVTAYRIQIHLNSLISTCSDQQISRIIGVWICIFKVARLKKLILLNPMDEIQRPKSLKKITKRGTYTDYSILQQVIGELNKMDRSNEKSLFNNKVISYALELLYETGIRPGECFAISKRDIDLKNNLIYIEFQIGSDENRKNVLRVPKTEDSTRAVPFSTGFVPLLQEMYHFQDSDLLFARFDGELFNMNAVSDKIRDISKKLGIEFNMYRCRHKLSTDLVTSNTDISTVMEIMGHTSFDTTKGYSHSSNELKKEAIEKRKRH